MKNVLIKVACVLVFVCLHMAAAQASGASAPGTEIAECARINPMITLKIYEKGGHLQNPTVEFGWATEDLTQASEDTYKNVALVDLPGNQRQADFTLKNGVHASVVMTLAVAPKTDGSDPFDPFPFIGGNAQLTLDGTPVELACTYP